MTPEELIKKTFKELSEEEHRRLEELIRGILKKLREKNIINFLAEVYLFLNNCKSSGKSISDQTWEELRKHLQKYWKEQQAEKSGRTSLGKTTVLPISMLITECSEGKGDDEILSTELWMIKSKSHDSWEGEDEENQKQILESMESKREQLERELSPFEFEALKLKTSDEVTRQTLYTLGFDKLGLFILFRRARIRMMWLE